MGAMKYECAEPECRRGRYTGDALYRVSAKGEPFEGKCDEHFEGVPDPVTQAVQARNRTQRGGGDAA